MATSIQSQEASYCPYTFHSMRFLPKLSKEERIKKLEKSGYNVFNLKSNDIIFDLSTDSHSSSISTLQMSSMFNYEHNPLGFGADLKDLCSDLQNYLNIKNVIVTYQGRSGEFAFNRMIMQHNKFIICNETFQSTQYHQKINGFIPTYALCKDALDFQSNEIFKGNIDLDKLIFFIKKYIKKIAYVNIELSCNSIGGYPVSLQNIKETYKICRKNNILLMLDSTRIVENALMIKKYEYEYKKLSIKEIVQEIGKHSDGCILSLKKDFFTNVGGAIAVNSVDLYYRLRDFIFNIGSDLPEEKIHSISIGIREALDNEEIIYYRYSLVKRLYTKLAENAIPILNPCSSYGVWIDVSDFMKDTSHDKYQFISLQNALYINSGIRSSVTAIDSLNQDKKILRLAIPNRMYNESHIDYIAESIISLYKKRFSIEKYTIYNNTPGIIGNIFASYKRKNTFTNIGDMIINQPCNYSIKEALYLTDNNHVDMIPYGKIGEYVKCFSGGLIYLGYKKGDHIGFIADNTLECVVAYLSTASLGIVDIPIYRMYSPDQIKNVILDAEITCLIISHGDLLDKYNTIICDIPWNIRVIIIDIPININVSADTFDQVMDMGKNFSTENFKKYTHSVGSSDLLSIMYSSGTTGEPKGVMVTQGSMLSTCSGKNYIYEVNSSDRLLLEARISHLYGRIWLFYMLHQGASFTLMKYTDNIESQIKLTNPSIIAAAPVFFEQIYQLSISNVHPENKLRDILGDQVRFAISGAAAVSENLLRLYKDSNIPLLQSYGSSETCGIASETLTDQKFGTVGKIRPEIHFIKGKDGELFVNTPYIMEGYYKNEALTKCCFVEIDGKTYYATGDIVEIDDEGYIKIIGRRNDSFSLACGYNIQPQYLERILCEHNIIDDAFVYGEGKDYVSALLILNENWVNGDMLEEIINELINTVNAKIADVEKIQRYFILKAPFSKEKGEVTETGKKKRQVILNHYKDIISSF